jgi:multidrug efflux pump subunit AcrB
VWIPGLQRLIIQEPGFGPAGIPVEIRLSGDDLDALKAAAGDLESHLGKLRRRVQRHGRPAEGKTQRSLSLAEGAHGLGLTAEEVASQLRGALLGEVAESQRIGLHEVEILVRHAEEDRGSLDDLADQTITLPDGNRVPLEVVANITERRDWARITRIDGRRTVTVEANVDARVSSGQAVVQSLRREWLAGFQERHPGIEVSFAGQVARSAETAGSIGRGLLIGLVGVFVILSFQFRSYVEPSWS